uniref:Glutamate/phenylalanine/leucine/valine/L-tryptophan dehydrogenase C-terminal domain-containing protein n=1 Tax=Alexandrium monilatum TaxID=311494 RepID=A0A7S4VVD9_9DINO
MVRPITGSTYCPAARMFSTATLTKATNPVSATVSQSLERLNKRVEQRYQHWPVTVKHPDLVRSGQLRCRLPNGEEVAGDWVLLLHTNQTGGAYKGEIRISQASGPQLLADAAKITEKALHGGISFGGAVANIHVDAVTLDAVAQAQLVEALLFEIREFIGPRIFVPAPGLNVSYPKAAEHIQSIMEGITGKSGPFSTGKQSFHPRTRATGSGAFYTIMRLLERMGKSPDQMTFALDGIGKSMLPLAELLHARGLRVVGICDSSAAVVGDLEVPSIVAWKRAGRKLADWPLPSSSVTRHPRDELLKQPCSVLVLGSAMDRVDEASAKALQVTDMIVKVANNPLTEEAGQLVVQQRPSLLLVPELLASPGGLYGSWAEMQHDISGGGSADTDAFLKALQRHIEGLVDEACERAGDALTSDGSCLQHSIQEVLAARSDLMSHCPLVEPPVTLPSGTTVTKRNMVHLDDGKPELLTWNQLSQYDVHVVDLPPVIGNRFADICSCLPSIASFTPNFPEQAGGFEDYQRMLHRYGVLGAVVLLRLMDEHAPDVLPFLWDVQQKLKGRGNGVLPHVVFRNFATGELTPAILRTPQDDYPGRSADEYKEQDNMEELSMLAACYALGYRHMFSKYEKGGVAIQKNIPVDSVAGKSLGADPISVHLHTEDVHEWPHYNTFMLKGVVSNPARTALVHARNIEGLVRKDASLTPEQQDAVIKGMTECCQMTQGGGIHLRPSEQKSLRSIPAQDVRWRGCYSDVENAISPVTQLKVNGAVYPLGQRETGVPVMRVMPLDADDYPTDEARHTAAMFVEWARRRLSSPNECASEPLVSGLSIQRGELHLLSNFHHMHGRMRIAPEAPNRYVNRLYLAQDLELLWDNELNAADLPSFIERLERQMCESSCAEDVEYLKHVCEIKASPTADTEPDKEDQVRLQAFDSLKSQLGVLHSSLHNIEYLHSHPQYFVGSPSAEESLKGLVTELDVLFLALMKWSKTFAPGVVRGTTAQWEEVAGDVKDLCATLLRLDLCHTSQGHVSTRWKEAKVLVNDAAYVAATKVQASRLASQLSSML